MSNFLKVKKFMETYGQEVKSKAKFPNNNIVKLRLYLIQEELEELQEAIKQKDLLEVADALTDILYVTYEEVQKSNMSKLGNDGKPIYNKNGKVLKGPNYFKPDLKQFLA